MVSTGEVACLGENFADAFLKALHSAEFKTPPLGGSVLITVGGEELKKKVIPLAKTLRKLGFHIYATEHTAETLRNAGLNNITKLYKIKELRRIPNILEYLLQRKIDFVINIPTTNTANPTKYMDILEDEYTIRRLAVEFNIPVVTTLELALAIVKVLRQSANEKLTIRSLNEYTNSIMWKV